MRSALGLQSSLNGSTKASRRMLTLALMSPEIRLYNFSRSFTGEEYLQFSTVYDDDLSYCKFYAPAFRAGVLESVKQEDENGEFKEAGELYR